MPARLPALLALLAALAAPAAGQGLQIHRAVVPDAPGDTDGMREMAGPAGPVWVGERVLDLGDDAVETVGLEVDDAGGTLSLWLSAEAGAAFADLTARSVGRALAVLRDGRVLTAPVVDAPIPNGLVLITGLPAGEAERLASALRGDDAGSGEPRPIGRTPGAVDLPERRPIRLDPPPGADPLPDAPAAGSAESAALAFARAVAERRWLTVVDALHPAALAAVRPDALATLQLDGPRVRVRDGSRDAFVEAEGVLGRRPPARLDQLADRDLAALHLAALDGLGAWGSPGPSRSVVGTVVDGDRTYVVLRPGEPATGIADVSVVTLTRDAAGVWRVLLTEARGF